MYVSFLCISSSHEKRFFIRIYGCCRHKKDTCKVFIEIKKISRMRFKMFNDRCHNKIIPQQTASDRYCKRCIKKLLVSKPSKPLFTQNVRYCKSYQSFCEYLISLTIIVLEKIIYKMNSTFIKIENFYRILLAFISRETHQ